MTLKSNIKKDKKYYIVAVKFSKRRKPIIYQFKNKTDVREFEIDVGKHFPESEVIHTKYKKKLSR
jgi:hypothetical protein